MPGFTSGPTRSRSADFPTAAYRGLEASDVRALLDPIQSSNSVPQAAPSQTSRVGLHPIYGTPFVVPDKPLGVASIGLADGPEVLADPRYRRRISALTDAVAMLVSRWAAEPGQDLPVAHICLTARGMVSQPKGLLSFMPGAPLHHSASPPLKQQSELQQQQQVKLQQQFPLGQPKQPESLRPMVASTDICQKDVAPKVSTRAASSKTAGTKRARSVQCSLKQAIQRAAATHVTSSQMLLQVPSFEVSDTE